METPNDAKCSDEPTSTPNLEDSKDYLADLVLEYLSIPRPFRAKHLQELEDILLPKFIQMSRHAWNAASPITPLNDPSVWYLASSKESSEPEMRRLNEILEEIGVHDLLAQVAASSHVVNLPNLPVDPYELRILKAAAHPNPDAALQQYLALAGGKSSVLGSSSHTLEKAAFAVGQAQHDIEALLKGDRLPRASSKGAREVGSQAGVESKAPEAPKAKRWKLFTGLGSLGSGLALLTGDSLVIPTVAMGGITTLPIIASLAGGIAAVGKGIGDLLREGE